MLHALLVDDDEPFLEALAEAVSRESFSTRTATSLGAAKRALAGAVPDVVLIDLHLPDGNGLELLDELSAYPSTEVVLITGRASVETAVEAMRRGAADYLVKPVDLARIRKVLANVSRTRELKQLAASLPWTRRKTVEDALPVVFGRYEVEAEIGDGAMGRVFRCRDPLVGRVVAVKTVKAEYLSGDSRADYLRRFRREAQAAGSLAHPGIVSVYDVGDDYLVMEYVEGATLHQLLRDHKALDFSSALRVLAPLAEALDYAHQTGVIHRDIKPSNIMVQPDGRPKLMDFGVARLDTSTATRTGHVLGSPSYMAPEQILGEPLTPRADLFSFAVVAYEALTGRRPFEGDSVPSIVYRVVHDAAPAPTRLNRELPANCDAVFARAFAKDPAQRFANATSFVGALMGADVGGPPVDISSDPLLESLLLASAASSEEGGEASDRPPAHPGTPALGSPTTTLDRALQRPVAAPRRRWPRIAAAGLAAIGATALAAWLSARPVAVPGTMTPGPLRVETQPPGMPVSIDGRPAGRSPLMLELEPGIHRVRVDEPGYAPAELTLQLTPGTTAAPLRFVMSRLPAPPSGDPVRLADSFAATGSQPPGGHPAGAPSRGRAAGGTAVWTPLSPPPAAPPRPLREGDLVALTGDVQPPRRISGGVPRYPEDARRLGLSGSVLIEMTVTEHGRPDEVRVLESAGAILDETVIEAVSSWQFEPPVRDGVKVRVRWQYRHTFAPR
jgi:eukaryotic-like serine/threonine-protein kinase